MINLQGKRMHVTETAGNGVVNHQTIFTFTQKINRVSAKYKGGRVVNGILVGTIDGSNLNFKYVQEHEDGKIAAGNSKCTISINSENKLKLIENFDWDQGQGRNVFEEID